MSTVKLSDRQHAALLALADLLGLAGGPELAGQMTANGRETNPAGAHQAANGLVGKHLATKGHYDEEGHIRYLITPEGKRLAAQIGGAS